MTTVLAVYNSEGCVGRCDATCHNAKHTTCICICGGRNHGAGFKRASGNVTFEAVGLTKQELREFALATKRNPKDLIVIDRHGVSARRARKMAKYKLEQPDLFE